MLCHSYRFSFEVLKFHFQSSVPQPHSSFQEILEDDDQAVEAECRSFIQHMETTFGQNIESYFV